jgi:Zn-dependent M28 family amino/carboxypeptidase
MSNDEQARMTKRLQAHVQLLAGDIGERNVLHPAALNDAVSYIESEWNRQGYAVKQLAYEVSGVRCANLEVVRDGNTRWREILLVGAHYDSVMGSPGANDNASGVAALLEISRKVAAIDPSMTVRFVAFVNEEPPFFMSNQQGSMVYAKSARHRGDDIRLMASLETIGWYSNRPGSQRYPPLFNLFYPDCANFIGMVSDFRSEVAMRRLAHAFRAHSDFPLQTVSTFRFVPGVSWSDHRSFLRQGYHAMMITDTALYRYPHYHAHDDTPDKLAYPEFSQVTLALCAAFIDIAQKAWTEICRWTSRI